MVTAFKRNIANTSTTRRAIFALYFIFPKGTTQTAREQSSEVVVVEQQDSERQNEIIQEGIIARDDDSNL